MTTQTELELPEPEGYYYEWDGPYGRRKFSVAPHNGRQCDRAVAYYTADQLRAAIAADRARHEPPATVPDNMQEWAKLNGVIAWHLIERHADNWADIGKMMDEFVAAKIAADRAKRVAGRAQIASKSAETSMDWAGRGGPVLTDCEIISLYNDGDLYSTLAFARAIESAVLAKLLTLNGGERGTDNR